MAQAMMAREFPIRRWIGNALLVIGLAWLSVFFLALSGLGGIYADRGKELTDHLSRLGILGPFLFGLILSISGMILREGRKQTVLFLRPFNTISNTATMRAFAGGLGNAFTVVTLDDGEIKTPTYTVADRFVALFVVAPVGLLFLLVSAVVLPAGSPPSPEHIPALLGCAIGVVLIQRGLATTFGKRRPQTALVSNPTELARAVRTVKALSSWAPRLILPRGIIFQSSHGIWKAAVEQLGAASDLAIIDVSFPSDSIFWELAYLEANKAGRFIVVSCNNEWASLERPPFEAPVELHAGIEQNPREFARRLRKALRAL
jgi:hypothetical protein